MGIGRRHLLKAAASLGFLVALPVGVSASHSATGDPIRAMRWESQSRSSAQSQTLDNEQTYLSAVYRAPYTFNAAGPLWAGQLELLELRFSTNGTSWLPWQSVTTDESHLRPPDPGGLQFGDLITNLQAQYIQYRLTRAAGAPQPTVSIELIDSTAGTAITVGPSSAGRAVTQSIPIISRAGWGADESLRFDPNTGQEVWPREYRTSQKLICHHTATSNFENDPSQTVRAIYYYHAITLGWGDIGYNFLIDWRGNVYEGRYGGDGVVGGHAYSYSRSLSFNYGSIGIGNLGTFTTVNPTQAMLSSLAQLITWKGRYVDPHGNTYYVAGFLPDIMGHRDAVNTPTAYETECPGDMLEAMLPALRDNVLTQMDGIVPASAGQIIGVSFPGLFITGMAAPIQISVKNTGTGVMVTQGPSPNDSSFLYNEGDTYASRGYTEIAGCWRVGVDYSGNTTGRDHPFRWGLSDALNPGQTATITGQVSLSTTGSRLFWAGLVQESIAWAQNQVGSSNIQTVAPGSLSPRIYIPAVRR